MGSLSGSLDMPFYYDLMEARSRHIHSCERRLGMVATNPHAWLETHWDIHPIDFRGADAAESNIVYTDRDSPEISFKFDTYKGGKEFPLDLDIENLDSIIDNIAIWHNSEEEAEHCATHDDARDHVLSEHVIVAVPELPPFIVNFYIHGNLGLEAYRHPNASMLTDEEQEVVLNYFRGLRPNVPAVKMEFLFRDPDAVDTL